VVAKWFNRGEEYEKEAGELRDGWVAEKVELLGPSMLPFEVANSIWRNPNLSSKEAVSLVRLLLRLSPRLVGLEEETAKAAMTLARKKRLSFYDASYLALARSLSLPLVTADREQLEAARGFANANHISSVEAVL